MNKRLISLIAALLVAIMLVPSVALAETPTITFAPENADKLTITNAIYVESMKDSWSAGYTYNFATPIVLTVANQVGGQIKWTSSDATVVAAPGQMNFPGSECIIGSVKVLKPYDGDVTLTAKLYTSAGADTGVTKSFKVPLETIKMTAFAFTNKALTFDLKKTGTYDLWNAVGLKYNNGEGDLPTLANDLSWKVDDATYATVDAATGALTTKKAGKVKVTATTKTGLSDTVEVTINDTSTPTDEKGVTSIAFTADKISVDLSKGKLALVNLLTIEGTDISENEKLLVDSSNHDVVTPFVDEDSYFWPVLNLVGKGTATVTVYSFLDPNVKASIVVEVTDETSKAFESMAFVPDKLTLYMDYYGALRILYGEDWIDSYVYGLWLDLGDEFDAGLYLKTKPGDSSDYPIFTSSDLSVASVNPYTGMVEVYKKGEVEITARSSIDETKKATLKLTIKQLEDVIYQEIKAITSPAAPTTAFVGDEIPLSAYIKTTPAYASDDEIIWISSNPQVAKVSTSGLVTAWGVGKVEITAYSKMNYSEKTAVKFTIEVKEEAEKDITEIKLLQDTFELKTNDYPYSFDLAPYIVTTPAETYDDCIIITSDDTSVVRIVEGTKLSLLDENYDALKPGTATLTVRTLNNKAKPVTIKVTHKKDEVKELKFIGVPAKLQHSNPYINLLDYLWANPSYYASEYYSDELTWVSDKPEYAWVDEYGGLYYGKPGAKVTITVTAPNGVKAQCELETVDNPVKAIKFSKEKITLKVNEDYYIYATEMGMTIEPADADPEYVNNLELVSSDPDVVGVDKDGYGYYFFARSPGQATVTAKIQNAYDEVYGSFEVEVVENALTSIKFSKKEYSAKIGKNKRGNYVYVYFSVKPYNANLRGNDIIFESSDRSIAEVDEYSFDMDSGMYKAAVDLYAPGTAKIYAYSANNDKVYGSTKVTAEAIAVKKVKLPKKSMKLFYYNQGFDQPIMQNYYKISPKIQPSNAWYSVTWETSNAGVAFVKDNLENGEEGVWIVATGAGTATITMNVDDGTTIRQAKMKVTVVSKTVDLKLSKKKATITMIKGKDNTLQLEAYDPVTEEPVDVKWKTSNKKVATVSKTGLVTAKKAGEVTISAITKDGNETTAVCNITVEKKLITSLKAKGTIKLAKKDTKQLKIKIKPADAYDTSLSFEKIGDKDNKVIKLDATGKVTAVGKGEATVRVSTKDGSKLSIEILIKVE